MSYCCELKANKAISKIDIDDIVADLPKNLSSSIGNSKQSWGWSCGCDIYNPKDDTLIIGGSYSISGAIADDFISHVRDELEKKGYNIKVNWE